MRRGNGSGRSPARSRARAVSTPPDRCHWSAPRTGTGAAGVDEAGLHPRLLVGAPCRRTPLPCHGVDHGSCPAPARAGGAWWRRPIRRLLGVPRQPRVRWLARSAHRREHCSWRSPLRSCPHRHRDDDLPVLVLPLAGQRCTRAQHCGYLQLVGRLQRHAACYLAYAEPNTLADPRDRHSRPGGSNTSTSTNLARTLPAADAGADGHNSPAVGRPATGATAAGGRLHRSAC